MAAVAMDDECFTVLMALADECLTRRPTRLPHSSASLMDFLLANDILRRASDANIPHATHASLHLLRMRRLVLWTRVFSLLLLLLLRAKRTLLDVAPLVPSSLLLHRPSSGSSRSLFSHRFLAFVLCGVVNLEDIP